MSDHEIPSWVTVTWDDGDGLQYRQGFLTDYEHIERPPSVRVIHDLPRVIQSDCMDTFRFTINGEDIEIAPPFTVRQEKP